MGRLALVHAAPVRDRLAVPWRRVGAVAACVAAALVLLYLGARFTPLFAVRGIELSGSPAGVRADVREAAQPFEGESLVGLDGAELVRTLEALPSVRSASYDRAFPHTLRITVVPEVPVAVVEVGSSSWIVSERGRFIRRTSADTKSRLPHFRVQGSVAASPGAYLTDSSARAILAALAQLPERFPAQVTEVRLQGGRLTMQLEAPWGRPELRLGEDADVRVKLAVAGVVLRALTPAERPSIAYVDVSVPERSVAGTNSQVEG